MATAAATTHCPECGAPVKSGDKQCWMCFRLLYWTGDKVKAAVANRFAEQPPPQPRYYTRTNTAAVVGMVLALCAMGPACLVACFVTCFAAAEAFPRDIEPAIVASLGAGFVVFVGFCILIGMLGMRITRVVPY